MSMLYRSGYVIKNTSSIGGKATDVSQIGYSILSELKEVFPANEVPIDYVKAVKKLITVLELVEDMIDEVVEALKLSP